MNERDVKDLAVFRRFMSDARGHMVDSFSRPTERDFRRHHADGLRAKVSLLLGTRADDDAIFAHAKAEFMHRRVTDHEFETLPDHIRASWIRSATLATMTFSEDAYRRLADITARKTVDAGLDGITNEGIRNGWIRAAEEALHVPAKLWDACYVEQNIRGMEALIEEMKS